MYILQIDRRCKRTLSMSQGGSLTHDQTTLLSSAPTAGDFPISGHIDPPSHRFKGRTATDAMTEYRPQATPITDPPSFRLETPIAPLLAGDYASSGSFVDCGAHPLTKRGPANPPLYPHAGYDRFAAPQAELGPSSFDLSAYEATPFDDLQRSGPHTAPPDSSPAQPLVKSTTHKPAASPANNTTSAYTGNLGVSSSDRPYPKDTHRKSYGSVTGMPRASIHDHGAKDATDRATMPATSGSLEQLHGQNRTAPSNTSVEDQYPNIPTQASSVHAPMTPESRDTLSHAEHHRKRKRDNQSSHYAGEGLSPREYRIWLFEQLLQSERDMRAVEDIWKAQDATSRTVSSNLEAAHVPVGYPQQTSTSNSSTSGPSAELLAWLAKSPENLKWAKNFLDAGMYVGECRGGEHPQLRGNGPVQVGKKLDPGSDAPPTIKDNHSKMYACYSKDCPRRFDEERDFARHERDADPMDVFRCSPCRHVEGRHIAQHVPNNHKNVGGWKQNTTIIPFDLPDYARPCKVKGCPEIFYGSYKKASDKLVSHLWKEHVLRNRAGQRSNKSVRSQEPPEPKGDDQHQGPSQVDPNSTYHNVRDSQSQQQHQSYRSLHTQDPTSFGNYGYYYSRKPDLATEEVAAGLGRRPHAEVSCFSGNHEGDIASVISLDQLTARHDRAHMGLAVVLPSNTPHTAVRDPSVQRRQTFLDAKLLDLGIISDTPAAPRMTMDVTFDDTAGRTDTSRDFARDIFRIDDGPCRTWLKEGKERAHDPDQAAPTFDTSDLSIDVCHMDASSFLGQLLNLRLFSTSTLDGHTVILARHRPRSFFKSIKVADEKVSGGLSAGFLAVDQALLSLPYRSAVTECTSGVDEEDVHDRWDRIGCVESLCIEI